MTHQQKNQLNDEHNEISGLLVKRMLGMLIDVAIMQTILVAFVLISLSP